MKNADLNVVVCSTPIRPVATGAPPLASMAVIQAMMAQGYDPKFYDIDGLRPTWAETERYFKELQPAVLGISAVVSTAYEYTKRLSEMVRRVSPKTRIMLGGNLAASAEILHRRTAVGYCVTGEGEITGVNLLNYLKDRIEQGEPGDDYEALREIKGLTFLDEKRALVNTGFEVPMVTDDLYDPDYSILEKYTNLGLYITEFTTRPDYSRDPRSHQPHRQGQKMASLYTSKGCVARCTFCHRWEKGYRPIPIPKVMGHIKYLKEKYNVGFIQIADENFGSDRRQVEQWLEAVEPLDILYHVAGVRTRTASLPLLQRLKKSGCIAAYYGMETGSPRILQVMEKKINIEHSVNAALWMKEAGLFTIYQLILGMPGETPDTVDETIEFLKKCTEILDDAPILKLSINFIQALPGTPVYEYAREKGYLGKTMDDEEDYLLLVSDTEAADDTKFINFTDWDYLTVQSWRRKIILECTANWRKKKSIPPPTLAEMYRHFLLRFINPRKYDELRRAEQKQGLDYNSGGYFNLQRGLYYDVIAAYLYPIRTPVLWSWLLVREFGRLGPKTFAAQVWASIRRRVFGPEKKMEFDYRSMREVVDRIKTPPATPDEAAMFPLRAGR